MPIQPENKHLYGPEFRRLREERVRSTGNHCELCGVANGRPNPFTGSRVVLTLAHWDFDPSNTVPGNMKLVCQLCHNRHDAPARAKGRIVRRRLAVAASQMDLLAVNAPSRPTGRESG
jgi:hypothetical protein